MVVQQLLASTRLPLLSVAQDASKLVGKMPQVKVPGRSTPFSQYNSGCKNSTAKQSLYIVRQMVIARSVHKGQLFV